MKKSPHCLRDAGVLYTLNLGLSIHHLPLRLILDQKGSYMSYDMLRIGRPESDLNRPKLNKRIKI